MAEGTGVVPVMDINNHGYNDGFGYGGGWFMWLIIIFALMGGFGNNWNNRNQGYDMAATFKSQAETERAISASNYEQSLRQAVNNIGNGIADIGYANLNGQNAIQRDILGQSNMLQRDILAGNNGIQREIMGGFNNTQVQGLQNTYALKDAITTGDNNILRGITDSAYTLGNGINQNRFDMQNAVCGVNRNIDGVRYDQALATNKVNEVATFNTQKILDKLCSMENAAKDNEIAQLRSQLSAVTLAASQQKQNVDLISAIRPCPNPAYIVPSPYCNCNCGMA